MSALSRAVASLSQSLTFSQDFRAEDVSIVLEHFAANGKQQVGEVKGDALHISDEDRAVLQRIQDALPTVGLNGWTKGVEVLERLLRDSLAARQPVAREPIGRVSYYSPMNFGGFMVQFPSPTPIFPGTPLYDAPPAQGIDLGPGVQAIAIERQRQMATERFTSTHDEQYQRGELAKAAVAYAQLAAMELDAGTRGHIGWLNPPAIWPWEAHWWKPVDARRDLVRAGALIAAQLDLIDQRDAAPGVGNG